MFMIGITVGRQEMAINKDKLQSMLHRVKHNFNVAAPGEEIPGELSPKSGINLPNKQTVITVGVVCLLLLYLDNTARWFSILFKASHQRNLLHSSIFFKKAALAALIPWQLKISFGDLAVTLLLSIIAVCFLFIKLKVPLTNTGVPSSTIAYGQKGDSRFTTLSELKAQYKEIPEKDQTFPGYGGFPISHYGNKYYIDDDTSHNIVVGTSRSGKGQTVILPMIDNLSRAEKQSSMVVNDPKKELYMASVDTLKKRGYDVYLLNLADPMNSMSYNPLTLATEKWQEGDIAAAETMINSISYAFYHKADAGVNSWVYEGAQSGSNANIAELIKMCLNPDKFADGKAHPERITLHNVADQIAQLVGVKFYEKIGPTIKEHMIFDDYFANLPQGSFGKQQYTVIQTSPENSRSSIYSSLVQGLQKFQLPQNAAMTSMNSIELRSIGFPKYIKFQISKELAARRIILRFRKPADQGTKQSKVLAEFPITVGAGGFVDYNFDVKLQDGDWVEICYRVDKAKVKHTVLQLGFNSSASKQNNHDVRVKKLFDELNITNIKFRYSDKPTAIFLSAPDYDQSNNAIISIFIQQLYSELARQCEHVAGNKTIYRVHFILDEFGNMLPITDMDSMMTVSAGRNILFTEALQSYQQLYGKYGRDKGETIKENGQNQKLIKTNDNKTNEDFSKAAGQQTVEANSVSNSNGERSSTSTSRHAEAAPLITASRLSQMLAGEDFNLRSVHRFDKWGNRVRPYPIFNHGKTRMPFAHTFLTEFDPQIDPNLVRVECLHKDLDLNSLNINYVDFLRGTASPAAVEAYENSIAPKEVKCDNDDDIVRHVLEKINDEAGKIAKKKGKTKMDDIENDEKVLENVVDEPLTPEQEDKRSNSGFALLLEDYRGNGVDFDLANKILAYFDSGDTRKVKTCLNSIGDDDIRVKLDKLFTKEIEEA